MDQPHSSSSSSSMSDASMSSSDHEPYDYEIGDPEPDEDDDVDEDEDDDDDDDDPHDDYEDVPDDDDEDEDEEEMDDDDDEHHSHSVFADRGFSFTMPSLRANLNDTLAEIRALSQRPFSRVGPARAFAAVQPIDNPLTYSPESLMPRSRPLPFPRSRDTNALRNAMMETFDALTIPSQARLSGLADTHRHSRLLSDLTARLRNRGSAHVAEQLFQGTERAAPPPSAVHPMLRRPSAARPQDVSGAASSVISSFHDNPFHPSWADNLGIVSVADAIARAERAAVLEVRPRIDESLRRIRRALDAVDRRNDESGGVVDVEGESEAEGDESRGAATRQAGNARPSSGDRQQASGQGTEGAVAQVASSPRTSATTPTGSVGPSLVVGTSRVSPLGSSDLAEGLEPLPRQGDEGGMSTSHSDRLLQSTALTELASQDLMRSVEPTFMYFQGGADLDASPRPRGNYDRTTNRYRDREKVHSGCLRRWTYDPPSCGGDLLPAMFDTDFVSRLGRQHTPAASSRASQPHVVPETHPSVDQLATRVIHRVDTLLSDMAKIDRRVADIELKEDLKRSEEKDDSDVQTNDAEEETPETAPDANDFAAVAARRAAAAGISLDAPANEAPEVVAAATESTGIDPAFLAALPNDMRAEILTQYYERANAGGEAGSAPSASATAVNQDFLVALPPALRGEVLELEAEFQSRHQASGNNHGAGGDGEPGSDQPGSGGGRAGTEIDNATFLATLAPDLREEILLTSAETFIQSLPAGLAAEARLLRERDTSSRRPWRMEWELLEGSGAGNGVRQRADGSTRHPARAQLKEMPAFSWKKVENGWLREGPKLADEPAPSLKQNGLSPLMQLLWLKQGQYVKPLVQQVFSHVCMSTSSRMVFLEQLIGLITSTASAHTSTMGEKACGRRMDLDRSQSYGTAVKRALELLTHLAKNDVVVAESLLGLPKTNEELARIPPVVNESSVIPPMNSDICLSTLVSLLDSALFTRSNSHLEQLVSLINTLCGTLPPTHADNSGRKAESRTGRRPRRVRDHSLVPRTLPEMDIFVVDGEEDASAMFHVTDERDDDEDSEEDPFPAGMRQFLEDRGAPHPHMISHHHSFAPSLPEPATDGEKAEPEKSDLIPPQYRIPGFSRKDLVALSGVLLRQGCSEKTYERVSRSIGILGELLPLRIIFVDSLVRIAVDAGRDIDAECVKFIEALESVGRSDTTRTRQEVIADFSVASTCSELTLLRVLKSLAVLWDHEADGDVSDGSTKKAKGTQSANEAEVSFEKDQKSKPFSTLSRCRPSLLEGLQGLWLALDKLLGLVSDEVGSKETKSKVDTRPLLSPAAQVVNMDKMKPSHRSISPVLARLSPIIEAFLVTHSVDEPRSATSDTVDSESALQVEREKTPSSPKALSPRAMDDTEVTAKGLEGQLSVFVERHRGPINAILRANPALLDSSFKGALRHPHAIDFDNKKAYFRNVIRRRSSEAHANTIRINVRRDRVFDDSYHQLRKRTPDEMKGRLHVQFNGEEGVDAGGVTREWYIILARQIFDPNYVLFCRSAAKAATYQPDKRSYITREHLENFRFVGRIIGKAIYDGQLLDAYFTRSFYKHILGLKPTYHDIEAQDPEYYKSLKWILENDITGVFDYTMSAEYDEFGKQTVIDLLPNGRNIPVSEENKADYVRLVTEVRMTKAIEKQIEAFKQGFHELIPLEDCKIFNELELELLMSGLPDIDMADLKANVEYTGYTASSPQVNWFWRCVGKMDQEDLARLVMFVTGTSKVPLEGFGALQGMNGVQKFQIHRVSGASLRLPSAHTCFNQLDIPEYSSAEVLSERLLRAVRECSVGFGFA